MLVDLHCHLDLYHNYEEILKSIHDNRIFVLSVCTIPSAFAGSRQRIESGRIRVSPGLHPELAGARHAELPMLLKYIVEAKYIGEIGIDGTPQFRESMHNQIDVFDKAIDTGTRHGRKIYSIHSRGASKEVITRISSYADRGEFVLHWYSGSLGDLQRSVDMGCWFSVGPGMLSSAKGREIVSRIPRDRLITESDGPFVKFNGRTANPLDVEFAVEDISRIWNTTKALAEEQIYANFVRLIDRITIAKNDQP